MNASSAAGLELLKLTPVPFGPFDPFDDCRSSKGHVNRTQWVKITYSFLQSLSNLFHFIILSLPT